MLYAIDVSSMMDALFSTTYYIEWMFNLKLIILSILDCSAVIKEIYTID
jgi:hypothetical protein